MSTKNVNTNLIFENLSTINNLCASLKAVCDNAAKEIEKISKAGSELKSYDGTLANKSELQNGDVITVYEARWDVNVSDTIINMSSNFNTTNVISSIDNLVTELNENEAIVEFIEQEINNLIIELSNNETLRDEYNNSFNSLRESIALDGKSAVNDKFVKISDDYVQYWTDEPLRFEYNPKTGAYLIFQGSVAMGWTNRDGITNYYKALTNLKGGKEQENLQQEEVVEEKPEEGVEGKQEVTKEEKNNEPEEIFDVDVPDYVRKEILEYVHEETSPLSSEYSRQKAYNELSDMAKQIINKEIVIVPKEINHYVEAHEDIVVPEGKILTDIGYRNAIEGEVLHYDADKNKYYVSNGGMGFSPEKLVNGEFIDK